MTDRFFKFRNPHAEIARISLANHNEHDYEVSVLLIPCFQSKEAEFFALLKNPHTGMWREFKPDFRESKEALLRRIDRAMQAEHVAASRETA